MKSGVKKTIEGKTKIIEITYNGSSNTCVIRQKDDITAGNGARHDVIPGKGELVNRMSVNCFKLLKKHGIPLAFYGAYDMTSFTASMCRMLPLEVVVRGSAAGSYCERNPSVTPGTPLTALVVEFYYKTKGRRALGVDLPCDDPLLLFEEGGNSVSLHHPKYSIGEMKICTLSSPELKEMYSLKSDIESIALKSFNILSSEFLSLLARLIDVKFEFGITNIGELVIADSLSADEWRLVWKNKRLDKDGYRKGESVERVHCTYTLAAALTQKFH